MRLEEQARINATPQINTAEVLEIDGKLVPTDSDGYLLNAEDWSPLVAETLAQRDAVVLGKDHWTLIDFLHRFYQEFDIAPEMPILSRNLCKDQQNCRWTRIYINKLFPGGAKMACRYAGLTAPVGRSCL
ncbi:MAG: TusE/DsrC/DsvC family sulfur relay protein [gamma proteobacterium endosymbiont of Lamellibrachia anaximandri]|nr:TusE/DsrC/DsvC family sulfur relay protein [gamma proteobacterium endosymbiont of Lamellibrachia anaximandri]